MTDAPMLPTMHGNEYQALRAGPIEVVKTYPQIVQAVRRTLGPEHAALFAEPNIDSTTGDIQWYPRVPGDIRLFSDMTGEERRAADLRLAQLVNDIHNHADTLADSNKSADHFVAENLRHALEVPDADHVALVGGQPVLFGWGHIPRGPATPRHLLRKLAKQRLDEEAARIAAEKARQQRAYDPPSPTYRAPGDSGLERLGDDRFRLRVHTQVAAPAVAPPPPQSRAWLRLLSWTAFGLLALAIGWLLLKHCALGWPYFVDASSRPLLDYCSGQAVAAADDPGLSAMRRRVAELDEQIRTRRLACTARQPDQPRGNPNPPARLPQGEVEKRVIDKGGKIGAVNVVLIWNTDDDLDLFTVCPGGRDEIGHGNKTACGGTYDVDTNLSTIDPTPVENIVWQAGAAPPGRYLVKVERWQPRSSSGKATSFTVELKIDGATVKTFAGQLNSDKQRVQVMEFELPWRN